MKLFKKKLYRKRLIKKLLWTKEYYLDNMMFRCLKYDFCTKCTYGDKEANCKGLKMINDVEWALSKIKG